MNEERLKLLEQFLKDEPSDPFNWYALALEESKRDLKRGLELFEYVLSNHPDYLPTYYHAGNLYFSIGNPDRATQILKAGIELAKKTGEQKTARELMTLLDELEG